MIDELNLSGLNLLAYALVFSCTKRGNGCWHGGYDEMAKWIGSTKRGAIKAVNDLIERGLVSKTEIVINGHMRTALMSSESQGELSSLGENEGEQSSLGEVNRVHSDYRYKDNITDSAIYIKSNIKKKNIKKNSLVLPFSSERFRSLWDTLCQQPKWKKKTDSALELSLKKLSKYDEEFAIHLVEEAIEHDWQGVVFAAKDGKGGTDYEYAQWLKSREPKPRRDYGFTISGL